MQENQTRTMIIFYRNETQINEIVETLEDLEKTFILKSDIFLYEKDDRFNSKFITFKLLLVEGEEERDKLYELRIKLINRKAKTNTFFTINALNRISLQEIGEIDPTYRINWNKYRNRILMLVSDKENKDRKYLVSNKIKKLGRIYKDKECWLIENYEKEL
jgi:hypothetical protein